MRIVHEPIILKGNDYFMYPEVLRDVIVDLYEPADVGIEITFPECPSVIWPSVLLDNVTVRGPIKTGIRFKNCWNATLRDCFVTGVMHEQTDAQLENATMQVGIDLCGSMDVHITNPRITCTQTAIQVADYDMQGHGEGLHVTGGFLMHNHVGVRLKGFGSGGWPTPNAWIRDVHIPATRAGVFATKWTGIHVTDCDFYVVQPDAQMWGVYLAEGCTEAVLSNNRIWRTQPHAFLGGYVLDGCRDVLLSGQVGATANLGLWALGNCSRITNQLVVAPDVPMFDHSQK